jgi:tRNA/rRNA methyltransferase
MTDAFTNIRIVLCEPSHPGNIGAAARAMKTMGLSQLCLVNPERFPDPEAEWRASRATDILARARVCASLDEALDGCAYTVACSARTRDMAVPAATARAAAARAAAIAHTQPVALVFGNETSGLTTEQVNKCRLVASIPANAPYSSLNLGAAVQVFAYELRLAVLGSRELEASAALATHEQVEAFYEQLEQIMLATGFLNPRAPKKLMSRMRRLFARAQLEKEEVNILRGVLKAIANPRPRGSTDE